jgi:hypothetical protein
VSSNSELKYRLIRLLLISVCAAAGSGAALGETKAGLGETIVRIDTGNGVYDVPYNYLFNRPPIASVQPTNSWTGFGFAFWMPDGRPTAKAAVLLSSSRPKEPGQPPPGEFDYVVKISYIVPSNSPEPMVPAEVQLKNILEAFGVNIYDYRERFGLIEMTPKPRQSAPFNEYFGAIRFTDIDDSARVLLRCKKSWSEYLPNHICDGTASLDRMKVSLHLEMPEDRLDQVYKALNQATTLLYRWKEDATAPTKH